VAQFALSVREAGLRLFRFRLIGYKGRPDERRFFIKVRPTLSGASVAPIKAIACGLNITRRIGLRSTNAIPMDFDFWLAGLFILDRHYELRLTMASQYKEF
jgi:hypothetical protein